MTSWEGYTKLIGSCDIDKWTIVRTLHFDPLSLNSYTQSTKSLGMSVKMFPNFIPHLLGNHIQFVKPLHVSRKEKVMNSVTPHPE